MVDKIHDLEPGIRITASKRLSAQEELFRDHFPGFPVVPGVLLTEMMAQAAGKCLNSQGTRSGLAILARINSAAFREWVRPEEEAIIFARIKQERQEFAVADCWIEVNGRKACSAELFFVFAPRQQFAPNYTDEILDAYLRQENGAAS